MHGHMGSDRTARLRQPLQKGQANKTVGTLALTAAGCRIIERSSNEAATRPRGDHRLKHVNKSRPQQFHPKAWRAVASALMFVLILAPYMYLLFTGVGLADLSSHENESSSPPPPPPPPPPSATFSNDICQVADAMERNPLQFASYTAKGAHEPIGWPKQIPHASSLICDRIRGGNRDKVQRETTTATLVAPTSNSGSVRSIFSFKSARSGSTFFTSVVTDVLKSAGRPTKKYWEPSFCSNLHKHSFGIYREASYQAQSLRKMLTRNCTIDPNFGCRPAGICQEEEEAPPSPAKGGREPAYIVAMNPRFLNQTIDWADALGGMGDTLRIFSLRRTNLILMAYSKFHHGGCKVGKDFQSSRYAGGIQDQQEQEQEQRGGEKKQQQFSFAKMLKCVHHYAIGDQELSMSTALSAAIASGSSVDPYLILYEDVLANGAIVQDGMFAHLRLAQDGSMGTGTRRADEPSGGNVLNVFESNRTVTTKIHSDSLCSYDDVDCTELEAGLKTLGPDGVMKYPCLWKQYRRAEEGLTWSVPLLRSGVVSLEGDCFPLEALDDDKEGRRTTKTARTVKELYRLS